ncbi:MAG: GntR family transcriptional regulator [Thermodesulfobacteriota bacterium]
MNERENKDGQGLQQFTLPESLSQSLIRYLETEIIEGRLAPGSRLVPEELAKQLGVSKSPVREALVTLVNEGLVTSIPRVGFFVAEIDLEDIENIYPIRAALYALCFRTILNNGYEPAFLENLDQIIAEMEERIAAQDTLGYFHANVRLYNFFLDSCGNEQLVKIIRQLGKKVLRFRFLTLSVPEHTRKSMARHRELAAALKRNDRDRAVKIAEEIIYSALEVLREHLKDKSRKVDFARDLRVKEVFT